MCAVLAAVLSGIWSLRPLSHDDVFWHLRTADWILAHHTVPTTDPFTFTRFGAPWISHEWGFAMVAWVFDRLLGLRGLQILTALTVLATGWLVARRSGPRGTPVAWSVVGPLLGLGLIASGPALFLRPALLAMALLAALLLALERYRESGRRRYLFAALAVVWTWANVHSNVVFGLGLLGLQAGDAWWERWRAARPAGARALRWPEGAGVALTGTLAAAGLLALCNPNGVRALLFPFVLRRILWGSGIAWDLGQFTSQSPLESPALLAFAALLVLALVRWRRAPQSMARWEAGASLLYLGLAFSASRFAPELAVVAVPALARSLASLADERPRATSWSAAAIGAVVTAMVAFSRPDGTLIASSFPQGAVRFLRREDLHGRPFHNSNQGGFLLWALGQPVFWDGRTDIFPSLTREVTTIPFPQVAERYGVDTLLLGERELRDLRAEAESERWGLVYWDDVSAVYLRRDGPLADRLPKLELKVFRALTDGSELGAIAADPTRRAAARAELERLLAEQPENRRALYFAAVLALADGAPEKARDLLRAALELGENGAVRQALALAERLSAQQPGGAR